MTDKMDLSDLGAKTHDLSDLGATPSAQKQTPSFFQDLGSMLSGLNPSLPPTPPDWEAGKRMLQRGANVITQVGPAAIGAAAGSLGGPMAPATVPLGAMLGESLKHGINYLMGKPAPTGWNKARQIGEAGLYGIAQEAPVIAGSIGKALYPEAAAAIKLERAGTALPTELPKEVATRMRGQELAKEIPAPPVTPAKAGRAIERVQTYSVNSAHSEADTAYKQLRELASQHVKEIKVGENTVTSPIIGPGGEAITTTTPIMKKIEAPVDLSKAQEALSPLWKKINIELDESGVDLVAREASPAYKALGQLMQIDKPISLNSAISAFSSLFKKSGFAKELPALKNRSEGIMSAVLPKIRKAIDQTASDIGGSGLLETGRKATIRKYEAADVLKSLSNEPVKTVGRMMQPSDKSIEFTKAIAAENPRLVSLAGRAHIEDLLKSGNYKGWLKLGPETKALIMNGDMPKVGMLDDFFTEATKQQTDKVPLSTVLSLATRGFGFILRHSLPGKSGTTAILRIPEIVKILSERPELMSNALRTPAMSPEGQILASRIVALAAAAATR
jgi:hypothetical protein